MRNYFLSFFGTIKAYIENGDLICGDPALTYAIRNNISIDNQNALAWANKRLLEELEKNEPNDFIIHNIIKSGLNPIGLRFETGESVLSNITRRGLLVDINNQSITIWATNVFNSLFDYNGQMKIGAFEYALEFLAIKELNLDREKKSFVVKAAIFAEKQIGIDKALDFALKNNIKLDGKDPRIWAIDSKLEIKNELKISVLTDHFRDKTSAFESSFSTYSTKKGHSTGYVGIEKSTSAIYMIKYAMGASSFTIHEDIHFLDFYKQRIKINAGQVVLRSKEDYNTMCLIYELVTSILYKRILYDRVPQISLVETDIKANDVQRIKHEIQSLLPNHTILATNINASRTDNTNSFHLLRSKYLPSFQSLANYTLSNQDNIIGSQRNRIKHEKIAGTEKLFATVMFCGELDIHAGNLGIITDAYGIKVLAKIDHGWSGTRYFSDAGKMIAGLANALKTYGYTDVLTINPKSLKLAIDEIIKISDEEIVTLIGSRIHELKRINIDIRGLNFAYWDNDTVHHHERAPHKNKNFANLDELEKYFIGFYNVQKKTMKALSERLDIISRIEVQNQNQKFHEIDWIFKIGEEEPMRWATRNRCKFDGVELSTAPITIHTTREQNRQFATNQTANFK